MKDRVFSAVTSITLALAAMALAAYVIGDLSGTDWVWWLPALTVALEGTRFIRTDLRDGASSLSSSADADPEDSMYVASCVMATAMALWGVYAGDRRAILIGTAVVVVSNALDWGAQPVSESPRRSGVTRGFAYLTYLARRGRLEWSRNGDFAPGTTAFPPRIRRRRPRVCRVPGRRRNARQHGGARTLRRPSQPSQNYPLHLSAAHGSSWSMTTKSVRPLTANRSREDTAYT